MARNFLYLTDSQLVSLATRGGRVIARREFAAPPEGTADFEAHLGSLPDAPLHLIVDLAEQDFRLDTIPHVRGGDRTAILNRKLAQIYRGTPFRHAIAQGRETEGRRDDRVVYTAITNPEILRPWLDALERHRAPLAGIHSAPLFSGRLLEELGLVFPHTLLVTFSPGEVVRQTYFRDREIKFSRLTPVVLEEGRGLGALLADDTSRTWQYLDSLRSFGPEDALEICVLAHRRDQDALRAALRDLGQIRYRVLDIEAVAGKLGLKPPPVSSSAEEVFVHLFLKRPPRDHFGSAELGRFAAYRRARIVLNRAAIAVLAASLVWGGWNLTRVFESSEGDRRMGQQLDAYNRQYEEIMRSTPTFGVGGAVMRDAVSFYNTAIRGFPEPVGFLASLSHVLDKHPQVRLTQLAWLATDDAKATPAIRPMQPKNLPPVKAIAKSEAGSTPPAAEEPANAPLSGGRYEVALVEGTVRSATNDFRAALAEVEQLAEEIRAIHGFRADVIESPLDVRSTTALQGRHGEESGTMDSRFLLRVVRAHEPSG